MTDHSRKHKSTKKSMFKREKRGRVDEVELSATTSLEETRPTVRTPFPSAGTKRTNTDLKDGEEPDPKPPVDSRGLYYANKEEIDDWYNDQHPRNRGLPPFSRRKHIKDPWYMKIDAWMNHKGLAQSPKKKRKLNDGTAISEPPQDDHPKRPDHIRYPGDIESVPEYPFDKLSDFEQMSNGRYACAHVNLEPPHNCCINGMTRQAKRQAIKKSVLIWKNQVERLIHKGKLNVKHKTWENWTIPHLREKYQPALYKQQEAGKKEKKRMEREQEELEKERQAKRKRKAEIGSETLGQGEGQQELQKRDEHSPLHHNLDADPSSQNYQQLTMGNASAVNWNKKRRITRMQPALHQGALMNQTRVSQYGLQKPINQTSTPEQYPLSNNHVLIDLTDAAEGQQYSASIPFEIWDHERLDGELERMISTNRTPPTERGGERRQSAGGQGTSLQPKDPYLTSLPQWCATGNVAVDGKMQHLLECAYQARVHVEQDLSEDERLLRHKIDESREDWQRFCDFFSKVSKARH